MANLSILCFYLLILLGYLNLSKAIETDEVKRRVIYGNDNRLEPFQVENRTIHFISRSACGIVLKDSLIRRRDGSFDFRYLRNYTAGFGTACNFGICRWEAFYGQPIGPWCSAFLVAPNLVVSAGHCVEEAFRLRFLFGFEMGSAFEPAKTHKIPPENVYECDRVVGYSRSGTNDWALFRLSRSIEGYRMPLHLRASGSPAIGTPLLTVGHPAGLPLKLDFGAVVKAVDSSTISANLDTFGGNSGGLVMNLNTLQVEGILISGNPDFVKAPNSSCCISNHCMDSSGCSGQFGIGFEVVNRISDTLRDLIASQRG